MLKATIRPTHLVSLSGGLDSAAVAYNFLKNNPDKKLFLNRVELKTWQKRYDNEGKAVNRILKYFNDLGWRDRYQYYVTGVDLGTSRRIPLDYLSWSHSQGVCLHQNPTIHTILICSHKVSHFGQPVRNPKQEEDRIKLVEIVSNREVSWEYPLLNMSKQEILLSIPKELAYKCWTCRNPSWNSSKCGRCRACNASKESFDELGWDFDLLGRG